MAKSKAQTKSGRCKLKQGAGEGEGGDCQKQNNSNNLKS